MNYQEILKAHVGESSEGIKEQLRDLSLSEKHSKGIQKHRHSLKFALKNAEAREENLAMRNKVGQEKGAKKAWERANVDPDAPDYPLDKAGAGYVVKRLTHGVKIQKGMKGHASFQDQLPFVVLDAVDKEIGGGNTYEEALDSAKAHLAKRAHDYAERQRKAGWY